MQRRGTTMLELVIAIGVIITGLITVVGLIARSITIGTFAKNKLIAISLAQEGIEAMRSIRDANVLARQSDRICAGAPCDFYSGFWNQKGVGTLSEPRVDFTGVPVYNFNPSGDQLLDTPWHLDFRADDTEGYINLTTKPTVPMTDAWTVIYRQADTGLYYQGDKRDPDDAETGFKRYIMVEPIFDNYSGCMQCLLFGDGTALSGTNALTPPTLSDTAWFIPGPVSFETPVKVVGFRVYSKVQWKEERNQENILITQDLYDWHD